MLASGTAITGIVLPSIDAAPSTVEVVEGSGLMVVAVEMDVVLESLELTLSLPVETDTETVV